MGLDVITKNVQRPEYFQITECIEGYFERHGDSPQGMGWPNVPDAMRRHRVMSELMRNTDKAESPVRLLDVGCGAGQFYDYLSRSEFNAVRYTGIDLSDRFVQLSQAKFPEGDFRCVDLLADPDCVETFDYAVLNGVFTMKCGMTFDQMWDFFQRLVQLVYAKTTRGIAFNTMAKHVDWERDDLFHLPLDLLAPFLCRNLSRNFIIRNDYGLYEYTTYVYHERQV